MVDNPRRCAAPAAHHAAGAKHANEYAKSIAYGASARPISAGTARPDRRIIMRPAGPKLQCKCGISMRIVIVIAVCIASVAGCAIARPRPMVPPAVKHVAQAPFDDAPVSFVVAAPRFTPGEVAIVRVCLAPDRTIFS